MKIQKLTYTGEDESKTEIREKILTIPIKPGLRPGTQIVFPEEGDQNPTQKPGIIFITLSYKFFGSKLNQGEAEYYVRYKYFENIILKIPFLLIKFNNQCECSRHHIRHGGPQARVLREGGQQLGDRGPD